MLPQFVSLLHVTLSRDVLWADRLMRSTGSGREHSATGSRPLAPSGGIVDMKAPLLGRGWAIVGQDCTVAISRQALVLCQTAQEMIRRLSFR